MYIFSCKPANTSRKVQNHTHTHTHTQTVHIFSPTRNLPISSPPLTFVPTAGSSLLGSFHNPSSRTIFPGPPAATGPQPDHNHTQPATSVCQLRATNGCKATFCIATDNKIIITQRHTNYQVDMAYKKTTSKVPILVYPKEGN
jgi:hypothetical protein